MPRSCTICVHKQKLKIEGEILDKIPLRDIAGRYGTSKSALQRHRDTCMRDLINAPESDIAIRNPGFTSGEAIIERIGNIADRMGKMSEKAESAGRPGTAVAAAREERQAAKDIGELVARWKEVEGGKEPVEVSVIIVDPEPYSEVPSEDTE